MRILIDTNVLISAFVFRGKAGKLLEILFDSNHELLVSEYVDNEFKAKLELKWADKAQKVYLMYHTLPFVFCKSTNEKLGELRDEKDIPVLSDALFHNADIILSGDKDLDGATTGAAAANSAGSTGGGLKFFCRDKTGNDSSIFTGSLGGVAAGVAGGSSGVSGSWSQP